MEPEWNILTLRNRENKREESTSCFAQRLNSEKSKTGEHTPFT
jgi:hypothetical protein